MSQPDFITLFPIILGIVLLFFGRKVLWLFIGAAVFLAVMSTLPRFIHHQESLVFYIAIAVAAVAAVAGYFLQKIAVRLAGFVAGGFVFFNLSERFGSPETFPWWLPFAVGGILGAILLSFLIEWALIILSSVTGAFLIVQHLELEPNLQIGLLVVLSVLGCVVQGKMKRNSKRKES